MLLVLEFEYHTHSFLFLNVLPDPQRTGMCVKQTGCFASKAVHAANKNKQHLFILIRWYEFSKQVAVLILEVQNIKRCLILLCPLFFSPFNDICVLKRKFSAFHVQ